MQIGPAYVHLVLHSPTFGNFQIFQTITPVEPLLQKVVHRFYASRLMAPIMKFLIFGETVMVYKLFSNFELHIHITTYIFLHQV